MNFEETEAPGFRFYPREEELISFYLREKLKGRMEEELDRVIPVLYIYDYNPWDLPQLAGERCRRDPQLEEWFFFIPRQEREARGGRPNRLTSTGYWKATGSPGWVYSSDESHRIIGIKRTMVFYCGRAKNRHSGSGRKTEWKMNEYMAINPDDHQPPLSLNNAAMNQKGKFTVCRVHKKSKCLRAFDRRPAAPTRLIPGQTPSSSGQPIDHHQDQRQRPISSDHQQNQPGSTAGITQGSSGEGSSASSEDHADNTNVNLSLDGNDQELKMAMEIDSAPLWDFDSLNWNF